MNYNQWIETKILKTAKKNYEDYPNQMKQELQKQADKYDLEVISYYKDHYLLSAVLKDKQEDRYINITINDLSCFKDYSYKNVAHRIIKNPKMIGGVVNRCSSWLEIGKTARDLIEWKKRNEKSQELEKEDLEK